MNQDGYIMGTVSGFTHPNFTDPVGFNPVNEGEFNGLSRYNTIRFDRINSVDGTSEMRCIIYGLIFLILKFFITLKLFISILVQYLILAPTLILIH